MCIRDRLSIQSNRRQPGGESWMGLLGRCSLSALFVPLQLHSSSASASWTHLHRLEQLSAHLRFGHSDFTAVAPYLTTDTAYTTNSLWGSKLCAIAELQPRAVDTCTFGLASGAARHMTDGRLRTEVFGGPASSFQAIAVSYTHLRAHETPEHLVCRLLLEKKNITKLDTIF
eukprot:TRINITY_DN21710_c0_g1_i1.p1 TRINITY_DN21710_c0_g1~~TRINITY_DN21710_c0_g1_i1.p1  ORF type:complete len:172 (+),score=33.88 TRINITY_DN21710_c0_g1_i1:119-634(+)